LVEDGNDGAERCEGEGLGGTEFEGMGGLVAAWLSSAVWDPSLGDRLEGFFIVWRAGVQSGLESRVERQLEGVR